MDCSPFFFICISSHCTIFLRSHKSASLFFINGLSNCIHSVTYPDHCMTSSRIKCNKNILFVQFTLFMAFMVMLPYLPTWTFHPEPETFRTDWLLKDVKYCGNLLAQMERCHTSEAFFWDLAELMRMMIMFPLTYNKSISILIGSVQEKKLISMHQVFAS